MVRSNKLLISIILGLGLALALLWVLDDGALPVVQAATLGVSKFTDSNDGVCDADCSLREAIIQANGNGEDDTITLGAGTYELTLSAVGTDPERGDLDITSGDALTITGQGSDVTFIDANSIDRVLEVHSGAGTVVISGVTVISGSVTGYGGGIYDYDAELILINARVDDNEATGASGRGGGIYVGSGSVTLNNSEVVRNYAGFDGGGVYVNTSGGSLTQNGSSSSIARNDAVHGGGGVCVFQGQATINAGEVYTNTGNTSGDGGGIYVYYGTVTLNGGQIHENAAIRGGGVFVSDVGGYFAQLGSSVVAYNSATHGGGVFVDFGSATLSGGQIHDNTAGQYGGGVCVNQAGASFTQSGGDLRSNDAYYGGGLFLGDGQGTLSGGQIRYNTATANGGGVFVSEDAATFAQTGSSIISYNDAVEGGGVCVGTGQATLSGGQILENDAEYGAGLYVNLGTATLNGGQILGNDATIHGGGVFVSESSGLFTQSGTGTIADNTATINGGGIYLYHGQATLSGGEVRGNTANAYGGGVSVEGTDASFTQSGGELHNNLADYGGGLFLSYGEGTLSGGEIRDNTATTNGGGVFVSEDSAYFSQTGGSTIAYNDAVNGGGVCVGTGTAVLNGALILENDASGGGGGLYNNLGTVVVTNTTISGNEATGAAGGGIYNNNAGSMALAFATIVDNTAPTGGRGIHRGGGTVHLQNTLIAYNGTTNCAGGLTSMGYNLETGDSCNLTAVGDQPNTNPQIGPLADNGGDTLTYALLSGSTAIDRGLCAAGVTTDQRGQPRPNPASAFCDIGAYESNVVGSADVYIDKQVTPSSAAPGETLAFVLTYGNNGPAGAAGVTVTDLVPNLTDVSVTSSGAAITRVPGTYYTWEVEDLAPGTGGVITITGILESGLPTGHVFANTATIDTTSTDGNSGNDSDSVNVTVNNAAPVAAEATLSTDEDVALYDDLPATDPNGSTDTLTHSIVTDPDHGVVQILDALTGSFAYTPTHNYYGTDSFVYRAMDTGGLSDTGTVTVTVDPVNDPPVAYDDTDATDEDIAVTIDVLDNDDDPEDDPLSVSAVGTPGHGTTAIVGNMVVYTPTLNFGGTDVFTYTVSDGNLTDTGTVTVTIGSVDDPPAAHDDTETTDEDTAVTVDVLDNDDDPEGDPLTLVDVGMPEHGTTAIGGSMVIYTPTHNYHGTDVFTYTISDGSLTDTGTVTITINPINDPPTTVDDTALMEEDTSTTIDVLDNDDDPEGDPVTLVDVGTPGHGAAIIDGNMVVYTPTHDYYGTDVFTYTASDGFLTDSAVVTVTISNIADPPVAHDDTEATDEDVAIAVDVLDNDSDPDDDLLTVVAVGTPGHGTAVINDNMVVYTPTLNYHGTDVFTYTVSDGGLTDSAVLTLTVHAVNDAPTVSDIMDQSALVNTPVGPLSFTIDDVETLADALVVTAHSSNTALVPDSNIVLGGSGTDRTVTITPTMHVSGTTTITIHVDDGTDATDETFVLVVSPYRIYLPLVLRSQ